MSKPYGHGMTVKDMQDSRTAQVEDENLRRARENPAWRQRAAQLEEIATRRNAERDKDHPKSRDAALAAFDRRNPDIIAHPGAKIRAFEAYEGLKDRASKGESFDWHDELTKAEKQIRQDIGWAKSEDEKRAEQIAEMRKARGQSE